VKAALELGPLVSCGPLATVHRGVLGGRAVAVKRARADVPGAGPALRREARVLRAASHPGLVPVLDVLDDPQAPALVLGWADGGSLGDLLVDGPVGDELVVQLVRPVAAALEALHRAGVAHLDVAPQNVLLAAAGPLLIDPAPPGAGTPGYTDPAVAAGGPASARSDVFGLAGCIHTALTGRSPRAGGGVAIGLRLPTEVLAVLTAGLHPDPRQRPATPGALVDRLERALPFAARPAPDPPPAPGRPVVRRATQPAHPPRTWPFERWQEEADAAAARRTAGPSAPAPLPRRARRRRPSASDSTPRPRGTRPPPTSTPGGNP
jgi:serine/threonine protein kinase